ncbi:GatB/YqeY domain-containing protein [Odoribacter sp. OttesenSCG-928-J03]|nr:GatB/YqeY domain-containing protein [Odoribacter sp. OttesenSCG-928-J03]MDL2331323.1 GatB/YqeY domain-containing protein [Odoribacter sp. OttesenSCG-928-A06]
MTLEEQVNNGIKDAMKAQDKVRLETLRNIKKVFLEFKTKPGTNGELNDADALQMIQKLAKQATDSASIYKEQGREDLYEEEFAQLQVLNTFLPKPMAEEELTAVLKEIIASVGATSAKDMGKVMGVATKQLAGKADGKMVSAKVKELLG